MDSAQSSLIRILMSLEMWFFVSEKDGQPYDSALTFVVFVILFNQRVRAYYVIHLYLYCKGRGLSSGHYILRGVNKKRWTCIVHIHVEWPENIRETVRKKIVELHNMQLLYGSVNQNMKEEFVTSGNNASKCKNILKVKRCMSILSYLPPEDVVSWAKPSTFTV